MEIVISYQFLVRSESGPAKNWMAGHFLIDGF